MEVRGRGRLLYLSLHCHHQNDSCCIKMGSDESRFNISLIVRDKVTDSVHRPQFLKRKESRSGLELRSLCLPASLPLGHTGSRGLTGDDEVLLSVLRCQLTY